MEELKKIVEALQASREEKDLFVETMQKADESVLREILDLFSQNPEVGSFVVKVTKLKKDALENGDTHALDAIVNLERKFAGVSEEEAREEFKKVDEEVDAWKQGELKKAFDEFQSEMNRLGEEKKKLYAEAMQKVDEQALGAVRDAIDKQ